MSLSDSSVKRAYFEITNELLAEILLLPEGVEVEAVHAEPRVRGLVISVKGEPLPVEPTCEGCNLRRLIPTVRRGDDGMVRFGGWQDDCVFIPVELHAKPLISPCAMAIDSLSGDPMMGGDGE